MLIKLRGGTEAEWSAKNPVLRERECGVTVDTHRIKVGDGTTAWNDLDYAGGTGGGSASLIQLMGSVPTYDDLPEYPNEFDVWLVDEDGHWYQWKYIEIEPPGAPTYLGWVDLGRMRGIDGAEGPEGPQGPPGADGADGAQGPAGPDGPQGDPGLSAYEVAVANGFVGTEAAWLLTLIGDQGPQGEVGPAGPDGPQGPQGVPGPDGPTGPAGADGFAARAEAEITTSSLGADGVWSGTVTLKPGYRLLKIETDVEARVRMYDSSASRTADAGRTIGIDPVGAHGVILDFVTTPTVLSWWLNPVVDGYTAAGDDTVPMLVTNLSGGTTVVNVTLTWTRSE